MKDCLHLRFAYLGVIWLLLACHEPSTLAPPEVRSYPIIAPANQSVFLSASETGGFQLWADGAPFYIHGAAGSSQLSVLAQHGGNTIRTYSTQDAQHILDTAQALDLKVILGLYLIPGEKGLDYEDPAQLATQLAWVQTEVEKYKDHPALLMWGLGNELELHYDSPAVWAAINETARRIHDWDPNHPTAAMVLGNKESIRSAARELSEVDLLGINAFGAIRTISRFLANDPYAWQGPYLLTEWGYRGPWEAEMTAWHAPIEESSRQKATFLDTAIHRMSLGPTTRMIGSCAFYWSNQHVERTHTWFNLPGSGGKATAMTESLQQFWGSSPTSAMQFQVDSIRLDGKNPFHQVYVEAGKRYEAEIFVGGSLPDSLTFSWELLPESPMENNIWLDPEPKPEPLTGLWEVGSSPTLSFQAPSTVGAYRLFCYVEDRTHWGSANVPFWVFQAEP
ncbi:MAG: hypothetical protein AAF399_28455 [Bacteroidota bacterium]